MLQYRVFVKDCLDLTGMPIANEVCLGFDLEEDLLSQATSNFTLLNVPTNIKEGDILGLVDPYGSILYEGVIESIGDDIETKQLLAIFDDDWRWHDYKAITTIEGKLQSIINDDFVGSSDPLLASKFPFNVTTTTETTGTFEQHYTSDNRTLDKTHVENFEEFLISLYETWGVIVKVDIPFGAGTPTITIGQSQQSSIKVGNNALVVMNMTPTTEVFETNKLVIYNADGSSLRKTYYGTTEGVTDDPDDPMRLPVIRTKYIFNSEDPVADLRDESLQEDMLNHKVEFDLLLDNNLYNFYEWELGMPIELWYNNLYFSTVYTAYSMSKDSDTELSEVHIVCGTVRNKLTEILNGR